MERDRQEANDESGEPSEADSDSEPSVRQPFSEQHDGFSEQHDGEEQRGHNTQAGNGGSIADLNDLLTARALRAHQRDQDAGAGANIMEKPAEHGLRRDPKRRQV